MAMNERIWLVQVVHQCTVNFARRDGEMIGVRVKKE